ncbi:ankyrin repeat domain-containing protein [Lysobacter solisilvae (ex Woo and Kim 2020)]|uniref:Ankyrin repeat domain-containing protein n=1 Tax=Agrilutibacter terrestris TaxID=2865112 RepID=A0A7H0FYJ3_9GAMM|nr:ankyrin repeat domain-containing protein [Lysobacter terrestris]QNP41109.1 ankyrin repeat domain-containing protein [Lysobacter terrestris]
MRTPALRQMLLVVLAGLAGPGCAKEDMLMHKVDVHEVFADDRVAELAAAVTDGDSEEIRRLASVASVDATGNDDVTLMQWAVLNGSLSGLDALLQAGADPTRFGIDGYTVLHTAAMVKDPRYLNLLLDRGVPANVPNQDGQTPLFIAIASRRDDQYRALLAAGAKINTTDNVGDTPLHKAALVNDFGRVRELLEAGADPRAINAQKATFQDYLFMSNPRFLNEQALQNKKAIRAWLKEHGVQVTDSHQ